MLAAHAGKCVMLVDDNFVTRESMSQILGCDGYRVTTASNGADAFRRLAGHEKPDVILLDLSMPVMDGPTFRRQQQQSQDLAGVPVVLLSAAVDVAEQAASLGAATYVQKPVDTARLLEVIHRLCER
jgi:CheY-like chemotaxis protein